jgi:hypothetical protein
MMGSATAHKARFMYLERDEFILLLLKRFQTTGVARRKKGAKCRVLRGSTRSVSSRYLSVAAQFGADHLPPGRGNRDSAGA